MLVTLLVLSCLAIVASPTSDGFCANVYQMHRHCVAHGTTPPLPRQGKAGPRGPKGEKGAPGVVDYDLIYQKISQKFQETEATLTRKLQQCVSSVEENTEKIKELERRSLTDCRKVNRENAKVTAKSGGVFDIFLGSQKIEVFCDLTTDGGGWTVFQRRVDGSVDFQRGWSDYVNGFGSKTGEFWLGLETLHKITSSARYELRVDMEDWSSNTRYAKYSSFKIDDAGTNYRLNIAGYSGTAGDSISRENRRGFSTKDRDSDSWSGNCAASYKGGWWFGECHEANLNGFYFKGGSHSSYADGINWRYWKGYHYSLKFVELKIRPVA